MKVCVRGGCLCERGFSREEGCLCDGGLFVCVCVCVCVCV